MPYLEAKDLVVGYEKKAVTGPLCFQVSKGDYLCIVGENGAGKSTLVKTLLGLQSPISGKLLRGDGLLSNEIGYLPQHTDVQRDFPASVWEIVLSGCQGRCARHPFYRKEEKQIAKENLKRLGIEPLKNACYRELSGGQQQRVLLARALCATRKILLLDEPVSGLDPKAAADLYSLILELNQEGVTIIMISHDLAASMTYASHILHLGNTVFYGTKEEYRKGAKTRWSGH